MLIADEESETVRTTEQAALLPSGFPTPHLERRTEQDFAQERMRGNLGKAHPQQPDPDLPAQ